MPTANAACALDFDNDNLAGDGDNSNDSKARKCFNPSGWGFPTWVTIMYFVKGLPSDLSQDPELWASVKQFMADLRHLTPCSECRQDYTKYYDKYASSVQPTRESVERYFSNLRYDIQLKLKGTSQAERTRAINSYAAKDNMQDPREIYIDNKQRLEMSPFLLTAAVLFTGVAGFLFGRYTMLPVCKPSGSKS